MVSMETNPEKAVANHLPRPSLPDLESHLGYWLRRVSNRVSDAFRQSLQARQVSVAEWVALRHLYDKPDTTPGELAELLGMTRGAISKVVDKIEGKGWVLCSAKPEDRRVQLLALTPEGLRLVPELCDLADANDQSFFGGLSPKDSQELRRLLQELVSLNGIDGAPVD